MICVVALGELNLGVKGEKETYFSLYIFCTFKKDVSGVYYLK